MATLSQRLAQSRPILLDGATGTELERRGVPMNSVAWSGRGRRNPSRRRTPSASRLHPGRRRNYHHQYFCQRSSDAARRAGCESRTQEINRQAAQLALQAREQATAAKASSTEEVWSHAPQTVWIAGSISAMAAGEGGSARPPCMKCGPILPNRPNCWRTPASIFLILEMMRDIDYSCAALEAAAATGLPVWVGFSCERTEEGNLKLAPPIAEEIALDAGVAEGGELAEAVMHSDVDVTGAALAAIQAVWDGPTGAYPESGYFTMPNWQFVDIIPPDEFAYEAMGWVGQGAQLVGGCCGIGTTHIQALAERLRCSDN